MPYRPTDAWPLCPDCGLGCHMSIATQDADCKTAERVWMYVYYSFYLDFVSPLYTNRRDHLEELSAHPDWYDTNAW